MRTCDCYGKFGIGDVSVATLSNMVRYVTWLYQTSVQFICSRFIFIILWEIRRRYRKVQDRYTNILNQHEVPIDLPTTYLPPTLIWGMDNHGPRDTPNPTPRSSLRRLPRCHFYQKLHWRRRYIRVTNATTNRTSNATIPADLHVTLLVGKKTGARGEELYLQGHIYIETVQRPGSDDEEEWEYVYLADPSRRQYPKPGEPPVSEEWWLTENTHKGHIYLQKILRGDGSNKEEYDLAYLADPSTRRDVNRIERPASEESWYCPKVYKLSSGPAPILALASNGTDCGRGGAQSSTTIRSDQSNPDLKAPPICFNN
ncbi:hypothetical protein B0H65DRAFT_447022 [Neurospora tetraspora]|uniref:Uncharacterized protein n=1 Tax=Neurospora tetraspora TaxID=94610 RepID=A0AAE0J1C9_9PEZI|nr:hypothetical protein B0H65DRAFT_447022 [Neurospora tetraspora]